MCGIVGFINCGTGEDLDLAIQTIEHRGPDGIRSKWFYEKNSGLAHARLSIIDLTSVANQPMFDPETSNWIIFNGEIYNYSDIRDKLITLKHSFITNSDTEVILKAYKEWGENCLDQFNGMFAFCIYNERSEETFIARDRLGIKPLYYWNSNDKLAFSSEIKALLKLKEYKRAPDLKAIQTQGHYQISPNTGFKDIYKLPAGHYLKFSKTKKVEIKRYWNLNITENCPDENEAIEKLDSLLNSAVELNLVSDRPVGIMLSGGLDSSILGALMNTKISGTLNSFTIKFHEKDLKLQGNEDDSFYARKLANQLGFNHHEMFIDSEITNLLPKMIYHLDEPISDPAAINTYLISMAAKEKGIRVLLNGMGADEVFGGYRAYLACLKAEPYQKKMPQFMQAFLSKNIAKLPENNSKRNYKYIRWLKRFIEIASLDKFERQFLVKNSALNRNDFSNIFVDPVMYEKSYFYERQKEIFESTDSSYLTKMCHNDTIYYMTDHNLTYCDKSMMAAGVEGRPTLIDHRIVEFMFSLDPKFRIKNNIQKYILKKAAEKYLPKEIIYRSKVPFSAPMRGWLKNELKEMVNDLLSESSIKKRGVYNANFVKSIIAINERGTRDHSQLIFRLLVTEIWHRTFFDNN